MNAERYQRAKEVFFAACGAPAEERLDFIRGACADDTALFRAVTELLHHDNDPLNLTAISSIRSQLEKLTDTPIDRAMPERIAGFRIVDTLGAGGMGVVYRAEQDHPRRTVALKVLAPGQVSAATVRRFELEAQVLARLKHPGIAHIYEAGTWTSEYGTQPYFAMELINGRPLSSYVEQTRASTRQRLALFAQICDAVEHAHQRGVIHRDLKPANILLDETSQPPQPKVLDFGVARALDPELQHTTLRTTSNQIVGTVAYMSPEQVAGDPQDLDTRSDVYSLGVLLYELLSGRLPFELAGKSVPEAIHTITHLEPRALGTTSREFRGDISTIVHRALAHDKARRYQSVGDLARDVRHYLRDEPIAARRDSALYVLRKTLHRYRTPVAAAGVLVVVIIASAILAWSLYLREQQSVQLARSSLHTSLIAQAGAIRQTMWMGRRQQALAALAQAAAIEPTPEARNHAIAAMALIDIEPVKTRIPTGLHYRYSRRLDRCAVTMQDFSVHIVRVADGTIISRIPPPRAALGSIYAVQHTFLTEAFYVRLYDPVSLPRRLEVWRVQDAHLALEVDDVPQRSRFDITDDESQLAVPRLGGTIVFYDLATSSVVRSMQLDQDAGFLKFDPTGRYMARYHGRDEHPTIHDLATGATLDQFRKGKVTWVMAWSPDGQVLMGADENKLTLWDFPSGREIAVLNGHSDTIFRGAFSPDGKWLLTSSWDGVAMIWDVRRRQPAVGVRGILEEWSADGQHIGGWSGPEARLIPRMYSMVGIDEFRTLIGKEDADPGFAHCSAFIEPSCQFIFVNSSKSPGLRAFDLQSGREASLPPIGPVNRLAFESPNQMLWLLDDRAVSKRRVSFTPELSIGPPEVVLQVPEGASGSSLELSSGSPRALVVFVNQHRIARVLDFETGSIVQEFTLSANAALAKISPDGKLIAAGNWHGNNAEIWDIEHGSKIKELSSHGSASVAFSNRGDLLATVDGFELCIWRVGSWERIGCLPSALSRSIAFDPTDTILAVTHDAANIRLVDPHTMEILAVLEPPDGLPARSLTFSPDGSLLVASTHYANIVHVWDIRQIRLTLNQMGLDWSSTKR